MNVLPDYPDVSRKVKAFTGALLGTAIGDSLGLPMEGLSPRRQQQIFPSPITQRLVGRFGQISDAMEHTLMVAQSLLEFSDDCEGFQRTLARILRWWLACIPAGVGFATLRAILKLWMGFPPSRSGVFSAGNGPAMRSAVLGVFFAESPEKRKEFVRASTLITHRDPRAETAALAVADTAAWMLEEQSSVEWLHTNFRRCSRQPRVALSSLCE
jgi:ADP-ribosyl-[dinitrogen reductase] hydrolase